MLRPASRAPCGAFRNRFVEKRIGIHEDGKIVEIVLSDTAQGEAVSATNLLRRLKI
jgi:hypothetical protein